MTLATQFTAAVRSTRTMAAAVALMATASMATAPATAMAGSITYTTSIGATIGTNSIDSQAVFTLGTNTITVTITNFEQNPKVDTQLISALNFDVSGLTGVTGLTSSSGNTSTIQANPRVANYGSYTAGVSTSPLSAWAATRIGATTVNLDALTGGKPGELIIGPDSKGNIDPSLGGLYNNAGASIEQHNYVVLKTATFTIDVSGVTSSSQLSNVYFQFGTADGSNQSLGVLSVPEPSTMAMGLSAMAMVAGVLIRGRRRTA